jgi:hypothetical protein
VPQAHTEQTILLRSRDSLFAAAAHSVALTTEEKGKINNLRLFQLFHFIHHLLHTASVHAIVIFHSLSRLLLLGESANYVKFSSIIVTF